MEIKDIEQYLMNAPYNFEQRNSAIVAAALQKCKDNEVASRQQEKAKYLWCLEKILESQDEYINAFHKMKTDKFYEGWCSLEKAEIALIFLAPHFKDGKDQFHLKLIKKHTKQFQSLFPYAVFLSPEFIHKERCSICGQLISPRNACDHEVGEIYDGTMCAREMIDVQFCGAAFVKNPVQKYSVPFINDPTSGRAIDHYDYRLVKNLVDCLVSPFHGWEMTETTRRHPHSYFKHVGRNNMCPCGSELKYKKCCLPKSGVLRPHFQFKFDVAPPKQFQEIRFFY